jgi:expansin (peptidoglycan-binding protein)
MRTLAISLTLTLSLACTGDDGGADGSSAGETGSAEGDDDGGEVEGGDIEPCDPAATHSGEGTYYDADGSGNCSFPATPDDLMVGAMNAVDYAGSAPCGACVRITGPDGSVDVRIVDQCPECPQGDIDLSPEAFAQIAAIEQGRVPIEWTYIPCPVDGPIVYHFKDGSNPWWTAVQIRNHRHAIASVEVREGESWVDVPRLDYNYFVDDSGMGEGPLSFRVTDVLGNVIEDSGIPLLDDADAPGTMQFPECAP